MGVRGVLAFCVLLLVAAAAGCIQAEEEPDAGNDRDDDPLPPLDDCVPPEPAPETPGVGPEQGTVTNQDGLFTYSGQVVAKTGVEHHPWRNDRGEAYVTWGGQNTAGTLRMTIYDACGATVYDTEKTGPSQGSSVEETSEGQPGDWLLAFEFVAYTAQMGLTIQAV